MRIAVLGGAGVQGSVTVKDLVKQDDVTSIVIGDLDQAKAEALAKKIGSEKVHTAKVDVFDPESLRNVLRNVDVVVNTTGPFYKLTDRVARAAIEEKVHYVDICDDPQPTIDLLELDESARKAEVTLIIGMGSTPGATNLLAKAGADRMDTVDEIKVAWLGKVEGQHGEAVIEHGFHMLEAPIPQFLNGELREVEPFSGSEPMEFTSHAVNGSGYFDVVYIKHPEPVTLYRYIEGVKTVTVKANSYPEEYRLDGSWKQMAEMGMTSTHPILVKGAEISPRDFTIAMMKQMMEAPQGNGEEGSEDDYGIELVVEVYGEKDGKRVKYRGYMEDTLERATGLPAAIAAVMLGRGLIQDRGAFAPEGCVDPTLFKEELQKRNIRRLRED